MKKIVRNNVITSLFVSTCMLCMKSLSLQWIHGASPPPPRSAPQLPLSSVYGASFGRRLKIFTVCKTRIGRLIRQWVHLLISLVWHWGQTGSINAQHQWHTRNLRTEKGVVASFESDKRINDVVRFQNDQTQYSDPACFCFEVLWYNKDINVNMN